MPFLFRIIVQLINVIGGLKRVVLKESISHRKLSVSVEKPRKMTKTNEKSKLNLKPEEKKFENIIKYNNHQ